MYVDNREAVVPQMNYVVVFNIDGNVVNVLVFSLHLESCSHKILLAENVNKMVSIAWWTR